MRLGPIAAAAILSFAFSPAAVLPLRAASADPLVAKVRAAASATQRKSWKQGVLAQAFLEEGDDAVVMQMARASQILMAGMTKTDSFLGHEKHQMDMKHIESGLGIKEEKKCICPVMDVVNFGCKCGGI